MRRSQRNGEVLRRFRRECRVFLGSVDVQNDARIADRDVLNVFLKAMFNVAGAGGGGRLQEMLNHLAAQR